MSYIAKSEPKPFTLDDFYCKTKFTLSSANNGYKNCYIRLDHCYCGGESTTTEITITIWLGLKGCGRHNVTLNDVASKIDAKDLLIELAKTFANEVFEKNDCYIRVNDSMTF